MAQGCGVVACSWCRELMRCHCGLEGDCGRLPVGDVDTEEVDEALVFGVGDVVAGWHWHRGTWWGRGLLRGARTGARGCSDEGCCRGGLSVAWQMVVLAGVKLVEEVVAVGGAR